MKQLFAVRILVTGFLAAAALYLPFSRAHAAVGDLEGSKETPLLKRYQGAVITAYAEKEFDDYDLPLSGVEAGKLKKSQHLEGKVTRVTYKAPANRSSLEIFRNYEAELKEMKFEILFRASGVDLDGFEVVYKDSSGPVLYGGSKPCLLVAKLTRPGGDVYISLYVAGCSAAYANDTISEGQPFVQLETVEVKPMEAKMETAPAK